MRNYCVYCHTFPNGKRYFGITKSSPIQRWHSDGSGYSKEHQPAMYNAIKKYGWENIKHDILFENLTCEEAKDLEVELIEKYKTNCHSGKQGYNMTNGGDGAHGHIVTDEARKLMSFARQGKTGVLCPNSKPVICDGVLYDSLTIFCEKFELNHQTVSKWLIGEHAMPMEWYNKGLNYFNSDFTIRPQEEPHAFTCECDGINFTSQAEMARYLGINPATITIWRRKQAIPRKYINRNIKLH